MKLHQEISQINSIVSAILFLSLIYSFSIVPFIQFFYGINYIFAIYFFINPN